MARGTVLRFVEAEEWLLIGGLTFRARVGRTLCKGIVLRAGLDGFMAGCCCTCERCILSWLGLALRFVQVYALGKGVLRFVQASEKVRGGPAPRACFARAFCRGPAFRIGFAWVRGGALRFVQVLRRSLVGVLRFAAFSDGFLVGSCVSWRF